VTIEPGISRSEGRVAFWPVALPDRRAWIGTAAGSAPAGEAVAGLGPGTRIASTRGLRRIEALEPGDRLITRDNGFVAVTAVLRRRVAAAAVTVLHAGAVRGLTEDITLGRGQGLLWTGRRVSEALGTREGFLCAGDLSPEADTAEGFVTLFLPVLARQEVIVAEGVALASALPPDGQPARQVLTRDVARRVLRG
jgi:hypothetical protein